VSRSIQVNEHLIGRGGRVRVLKLLKIRELLTQEDELSCGNNDSVNHDRKMNCSREYKGCLV
nr:hypothetical protein [Tanacetum cinerariifolium]